MRLLRIRDYYQNLRRRKQKCDVSSIYNLFIRNNAPSIINNAMTSKVNFYEKSSTSLVFVKETGQTSIMLVNSVDL